MSKGDEYREESKHKVWFIRSFFVGVIVFGYRILFPTAPFVFSAILTGLSAWVVGLWGNKLFLDRNDRNE
ncbi:cytochrome bd-type quinol oxidase, subunit 1 [Bacillus sp. OxB-1]|uniref:hypothetical protein n=1 Tax=Bacillus sp. (strain OxB-1) TaxID=98228 RepID=UPI00058206A0|nr:hypothetical protein [Bacillus sp. OxB-1]BAQ10338.1 cytochrome bd-type quinol oxidase, subunit 1 [Bacillus sp. OxB-1]